MTDMIDQTKKQKNDAVGMEAEAGPEQVQSLYREWFLDYASYVILDRAVPSVDDGLKPVQRRLLHSLFEVDDGRFNKAANIIGYTMKYHPHGDAAIGDALVKLGQKDLLVETQGNWGNPVSGDRAAAPRYIEARLTKFAKEVLFSKDVTEWVRSYDGRNEEPVNLPVKFPLLLAQGAEGIAVGLSTKILPHNFNEILKACISVIKGRKFELWPDFPTGGTADFSQYKDGQRGGKVKVRATIEKVDSKTIKISEIPFGTTTGSLIDSIVSAHDKGKIKIKKLEDNTAEHVEILIHLPVSISPDNAIEALFAFTDCEASFSPNCCVIQDGRPVFTGVSDVLKRSAEQTRDFLGKELKIKLDELNGKLHMMSLEQLFIHHKIYRKIEAATTWESVLETIGKGLKPYQKTFIRPVIEDDLVRLTEIKIKRISKFDDSQAEKQMAKLKDEIEAVEHNIAHLDDYTIDWFKGLSKYGKDRKRKTIIDTFSVVKRNVVAVANQKLYVNLKEGFIGTNLKKDKFVADCSALDEVIAFTAEGACVVTRVAEKTFVGKNIIHVSLFKRGDDRRIYNLVYKDGKNGAIYAKRFNVTSVTRDRMYPLTKNEGSKILYFSVNPDGQAEKVKVTLQPRPRLKKLFIDFDFTELEVKNRTAVGNLITKYEVRQVTLKEKGHSTLSAMKLWMDLSSGQLNQSENGHYLGEFGGSDFITIIHSDGTAELVRPDLNKYYGDDIIEVRKYLPGIVVTVVYFDGERKDAYIKRFAITEDFIDKRLEFMSSHANSKVYLATYRPQPVVQVAWKKEKSGTPPSEILRLSDIVDCKGVKAVGKKLSRYKLKGIKAL